MKKTIDFLIRSPQDPSGDNPEQSREEEKEENHEKSIAVEANSVRIGKYSAAEVIQHLETLLGKLDTIAVRVSQSNSNLKLVLSSTQSVQRQVPADGGTFTTGGGEFFTSYDNRYIAFSQEFYKPPQSIMLGINKLDFHCKENMRINAAVDDITTDLFRLKIMANAGTTYSAGYSWFTSPQLSPGHYSDPAFQNFQMGTLSTSEFYSWQRPQQSVQRRISFSQPYPSHGPLPAVVVWLSSLDLDKKSTRRAAAEVWDISHTGFVLHIKTWRDTIMYYASVCWLAYPSDTPGIYSGNIYGTSGKVEFPPARFGKPPRKVLLGLNHVDCGGPNKFTRLEMSVQAVTQKRMGWKADTWGNSPLYDVKGAFIAIE